MKIGIAGAGTMSSSMAMIFMENGYDTLMLVRNDKSIARATKIITDAVNNKLSQGKLSVEDGDRILASMQFTTEMTDMADRDIIIESIIEDLPTKQAYWKELSQVVSEACILATNTSGLSINKICEGVKGKNRFLGMHWFNPPHLVPLIEIICGDETDEESAEAVRQLALSLGKKPVICQKDALGFIANRLQYAVLREAMEIVERGIATPEAVDDAMKYGLGFRYALLGPFEVTDLGGVDVFYKICKYLFEDLSDSKVPQDMITDCYENGRLGVKSGAGFYDYSDGRDKDVVKRRDELFVKMYETFYENN